MTELCVLFRTGPIDRLDTVGRAFDLRRSAARCIDEGMNTLALHRTDGDLRSVGGAKASLIGSVIGMVIWFLGLAIVGKGWPLKFPVELGMAVTLGGFFAVLLNHRHPLQASFAVVLGCLFGSMFKSYFGLFDLFAILPAAVFPPGMICLVRKAMNHRCPS